MSATIGRMMGIHETVFVGRELCEAARGAELGPEAKKALRVLSRAIDALEEVRREAPPAAPTAVEEEAALDASLRALDRFLEAFAIAGDPTATRLRAALFPDGRAFVRARGVVKQGLTKEALDRAESHADALAELGATPFVDAAQRAHAAYVARLGEHARRVKKAAGVREPLEAAHEAIRRYADVVRASAVLAGDEHDQVLLAPLANRDPQKRAASATSEGETGGEGEGPSSAAA